MKRLMIPLCAVLLSGAAFALSPANPIALKSGDRVAMLGDSITAQKSYTRMLETYLELCSGVPNLSFMQFGWPGGTAPHALGRMPNDVLGYKPTVTTVMFGINDGRYKPYSDSIALPFQTNMFSLVRKLKSADSRVLLLSPSTMDPTSGNHAPFMAALNRMSERIREVAEAEKVGFADVNARHHGVQEAMVAKLGKGQCKFSADGVHDFPIGHFIILSAALDGFALDKSIAEISFDAAAGKASANAGHKIVSAQPGELVLESTRYPYCFPPHPKNFGENPALALPFVDFQDRYNRFMLRVSGLTEPRAQVVWSDAGGQAVTNAFTRAELEKGVNLADAFRVNPFVKRFYAYFEAALDKECFEVDMTCTVIPFANWTKEATGKDFPERFKPLFADLFQEQERRMAALKKLHKPIRHTLTVTGLK